MSTSGTVHRNPGGASDSQKENSSRKPTSKTFLSSDEASKMDITDILEQTLDQEEPQEPLIKPQVKKWEKPTKKGIEREIDYETYLQLKNKQYK